MDCKKKLNQYKLNKVCHQQNVGKLDAIKQNYCPLGKKLKRCTTDFISSVPLLNKGLNLAYSGVNKLKSGLTGLGKDVVRRNRKVCFVYVRIK